MIRPTLEEVKKIAEQGDYKIVPVSMEILSDVRTPIEVLRILKKVSDHCYMLESAASNEKWGRYTFLGYDPKQEIVCTDHQMTVNHMTFQAVNPGIYIRQLLREHKSPVMDYLPS
ncbi:MAG TPA: anthranilate synthase component I, partial [Lachnospiraceae bacterium]|nr:anthranilate synthase component I [Lachnospiraceae bacterium]